MKDEKMAKEYAKLNARQYKRNNNTGFCTSEEEVEKAFLAGLKAGKDMADADLATIAYMQGAERYKPKWHKVADGDLPEEDKSIMIYAKLADGVAVGKRRKQGKVYEWYFATYDGTFCLRDKEVIAWKEIVLPELKESE